MMIPKSVKKTLDKRVPAKTESIVVQPAAFASSPATITPMIPKDKTFEHTYSYALSGVMAKNEVTLWLFSSKTIAPIKKSPMAAGSEKIRIAAAFPFHEAGRENNTMTYRMVKNPYSR
jgi:hypothetical protein